MRTTGEFIALLGRFGESLQDLQPELQEISEQIVEDLKAGIRAQGLVDTGDLLRSVRAQATSNSLEISMLSYGLFNNYGVGGSESSPTNLKKVEFGVTPRPSSEPYYRFRKRRFGIQSRQFFTVENLQQQVGEEILITITGTFN